MGDRLWCIEVGAPETSAWPHVRRPHAFLPSVVQIELEVVQRTAEETEAEDRCTLRELWRSDDEPCREFSLSLSELAAFARARAFWDSEDERWSKARAQKEDLDQRRTILLQPGPHHVMRP